MIVSCTISKDDDTKPFNLDLNQTTTGTGSFDYNYQFGTVQKNLKIFYHIPVSRNSQTKIVFVFHGVNRNADEYRNALISKAEQYNFIVIAPQFSNADFPGINQYNFGNVYQDGENPSSSTLNPEGNWSFSIIEPLFDHIKSNLNNTNNFY